MFDFTTIVSWWLCTFLRTEALHRRNEAKTSVATLPHLILMDKVASALAGSTVVASLTKTRLLAPLFPFSCFRTYFFSRKAHAIS
jgi:hypothetical protein